MRTFRPVVALGLAALAATLVTTPAAARGGPPAERGGPPAHADGGGGEQRATNDAPDWTINWDQVEGEADEVRAELAGLIGEQSVGDVLTGEIAGAAYIIQVPRNWNGDLVMYAHGYAGEGPDLEVDAPPAYQFLSASGYAWAASSYRRNSYDPGIGVIDTKNLTVHAENLLRSQYETDDVQLGRTYLTGASMGGHVTAAAIEKYRGLYDGAMPICGVLGDVELFDYFLDYNLGAAALAGVPVKYPDSNWVAGEVVDIKSALSFTPTGVPGVTASWAAGGSVLSGGKSALTPTGRAFKDFVRVGAGGFDSEIHDVAWDFWHLLASPTGDFFFDLGEGDGTIAFRNGIVGQNSDTVYGTEYGAAFSGLDETVERVEGSNRVRRAQGNKPAPIVNGTPDIPVLSLHTVGDLFVPIEMELIYAQEVAANGLSDNLVQRAIRDVGHCSFSGDELIRGYSDLFAWVATGTAPPGEDLLATIAEPTLGCEFTQGAGSPIRAFLPACPSELPGD